LVAFVCAVIHARSGAASHFERSEKSLTGGAGGEIPPLYVSTLIPAFSQREKETMYAFSELTT